LDDTGTYNCYEANVNENDEDFVMRGNVTVISEANLDGSTTTYRLAIIVLILLDFAVNSTYNFKDLRGDRRNW
jgi:hypothetical protein